jgi:hypothetical protein
MLLGKYVLMKAREGLSAIDSGMIAEIRSYIRPPALIHKLIKCVLYVFGHSIKEGLHRH